MIAYRFIIRILIAISLFAVSTIDVHAMNQSRSGLTADAAELQQRSGTWLAYLDPCGALGVCDTTTTDDPPPAPDPGLPPPRRLPPEPVPTSGGSTPRVIVPTPTPPPPVHAAAPIVQPTITHGSAPLPASGTGMTGVIALAMIASAVTSHRFLKFSHQKS
jgi:hypothetical protein